jgi:arsenate reductase
LTVYNILLIVLLVALHPQQLFPILSDETRLRVLMLLMREGELCVGELAHALRLIQPKVSRHLAVLRDSGIIDDRRQGQWVFYQLSAKLPAWVSTVLAAAATATMGHQQLRTDRRTLAAMHSRPGARYQVSRIIFFCSTNSCRSQMAEGWARHFAGEHLEVRSAGIKAGGRDARAVAVMREAGVDISGQESARLTPQMLDWAELVVTVCDHADEHLLWLPPGTRKEYWPIKDPAAASGADEVVLNVYRSSRDNIGQRVRRLVARIQSALKAA